MTMAVGIARINSKHGKSHMMFMKNELNNISNDNIFIAIWLNRYIYYNGWFLTSGVWT